MKTEIHPKDYRPVLFIDNASGEEFIIPSTVATKETATRSTSSGQGVKADKKEYPVFRVEISSSSHPFYTGETKVLDTAGRVERFKQKRAKASKPKANHTSHKATKGKGSK